MGIKEKWKRFKPLPRRIKGKLSHLTPLFEKEGILLVYLFGSLTRGDNASDVDLALLGRPTDLRSLRERICDALGTQRLDLVHLTEASPVLRFEVVANGTLIFRKNDQIENDFELSVLREYRDTAHLRNRQAKTLEERTGRWS